MADTVKVTPASKKIEFFDADSTPFQGKISLDSSDNLVLESPNDIYLGDSSATLSIATDMLFSASKKIAASANNVDITIGDTSSLTGNDIIIDSHSWSVTSGGAATFAGGILGGILNDTGAITTPAAASGGYKHVQLTANNNLYGTNRSATFSFRAPNSASQPHMMVYGSDRAAIAVNNTQSNASPSIWLLHDYYQPILDQTGYGGEDFGLANASSMVSSGQGTATNDPVILTLIDSGDTNSGDAIMAVGTGTSGGGTLNQIADGKLYFKIDDSGDAIFYKNVGIANHTPAAALHVEGDGLFTNTMVETTLDGAISAGATTITLTDASGFVDGTGYGAIDNSDQFSWTGKSGNQLTGVTGVATSHADNVVVTHSTDASILTLRCIGGPASSLQSQLKLEADDYRGAGIRFESSGDDSTYTPWFAGRPYASQGFQIGYHATQPEYKANAVMFLETNGRVGIGNTAPATLLHLQENGTGAAVLRMASTNVSYPNDTAFGRIEFWNNDASGAGIGASIDAMSNGSGRGGWLQFQTGTSGNSQTVKMVIDENGNVGINAATPTYKLDVNGTSRFTNDLLGNSRIRCDKATGEVEFNSTDGVFLLTEFVAVGGTPTTPLYNNQNQNITSVTTYGNCVRVSGTGGNTNFEPLGTGGARVMLFAVVLGNTDGSVSDTFQSFDCTVYVGDAAHNYVHRKTIKCLYEGSSTNLIYSYVDEMENFTNDMIDVKVDMVNGNAQIVNMSTSNIQVARVYIEFGNLSGLTPNKIQEDSLDWSWEFTGLKDEAHVG